MVSVLIIAHSEIANSFAYCLEHIMNKRVDNLVILPIRNQKLRIVSIRELKKS